MNIAWLTREEKQMLLVVLLLGIGVILSQHMGQTFRPSEPAGFPTKAFIGDRSWKLDVAATPETRTLGLGDRDSYPLDRGMLFLFDRPDQYGFWMRGMHFPIDIIFLSRGKIISIERSFQPSDSRIVTPPKSVDQVLEVNAGQAAHVSPGDRVWYWRSF